MRCQVIVLFKRLRDTWAEMGIDAAGQKWQQSLYKHAHLLRIIAQSKHNGSATPTIKQYNLLQLALFFAGIPGGVGPEKVVKVANPVDMQSSIAAQIGFDPLFIMQTNRNRYNNLPLHAKQL